MPFDDEFDELEGFEPDDDDDDIGPNEQLNRWLEGRDLYLPDDFIRDLQGFQHPENIRGIVFANILDALEWLEEVGVLTFSNVLQEGEFFRVAIGESP